MSVESDRVAHAHSTPITQPSTPHRERLLFITGRLAEPAVRGTVRAVAAERGFDYAVAVVGVQVAAFLHTKLLLNRLPAVLDRLSDGAGGGTFDRALLPGTCDADPAVLAERFGFPFEVGPRDVADLPQYFGRAAVPPDLSMYDLEILAEINHAPRLPEAELLRIAGGYRDAGADVIDVGCVPGEPWGGIGDAVRRLRDAGHRVSVDSFDRGEVTAAGRAGAELVLSCNATNVDWAAPLAADTGTELVAIPDTPSDLDSLFRTADRLAAAGVRHRLDPILEPLGFGFAASLGRYLDVRRRRPDAAVLMGVGNLTELTAVDSAGVNVLLAGFCQEQGIRSVLTTQVIDWCRSCVAELDVARRMLRCAADRGTVPKHLTDELVMLRDVRVRDPSPAELADLAASLTDPNFRVFAAGGEVHLMNRLGHWHARDPFAAYAAMVGVCGPPESSHAMYLGFELQKAATALTLGKRYVQDRPLDWGLLTEEAISRLAVADRRRAGSPAVDRGGVPPVGDG